MNKGNNPFKTSAHKLIVFSIVWALVLFFIGGWWIYLMTHFTQIMQRRDHSHLTKMIYWEGGSFLFILMALSVSLFILLYREEKKTRAMQTFFASLTHELKTPLASMKLQGEVLISYIEQQSSFEKISHLAHRLVKDANKLESMMDKFLQFSRLENQGLVHLEMINLHQFITDHLPVWEEQFPIKIIYLSHFDHSKNQLVLAETLLLEMIFKNLLQNTINHSSSKEITITHKTNTVVEYSDHSLFKGDFKKLGDLFYKGPHSKGSGIGLYLLFKIMKQFRGEFQIECKNNILFFNLKFQQHI